MPKRKASTAGAEHLSKLAAAAEARPNDLVGRRIDVPNGLWDGCDDGGYVTGCIVKAGRTRGVVDFQVGRFDLDNNGKRACAVWIMIDKVVGQTTIGSSKLTCHLHAAAAPKAKAAAATAASGAPAGKGKQKQKALRTDEDAAVNSDDLNYLSEWLESFDKATPLPVHASARGGLKVRLPANPKALDFHRLACPKEVYELVLEKTLAQAQAREFDWSKTDSGEMAGPNGELTLPELRVFLAITMLMSLVKLTRLRDYWSENWLGQDMVKEHFTVHRFEAILSNLHFAEADDRPEPMEEGSDRLAPESRNWKMDEVQTLFTNAWCRAGAYTQFLAMDESMIKYRGHFDIRKQRLPSKPIKNGLKAFVLAGALGPLRGYVHDLSIYGGAGDGADDEAGAKANYVTRLLDPELDGKGYAVVTDNFYSSDTLALELNKRGIGFVGTVNSNMTSFPGFEKPQVGVYQSGEKSGQPKYGPAVEPHKFRTATRALATIQEENEAVPSSSFSTPTKPLSDRLYFSTWSDSSKSNPVSLIANFAEAEQDTCIRQPKKATEENSDCSKEERECPWIAKIYGMYYGGVDTADMDINTSRFDHKSCVPGRCRSYHRVWWALHGWAITNGWRLRRVVEAEEAETNDWYHYPCGRVYYTPLRVHMKELVDEIIADATKEGFRTTRVKPGRKHVHDSTLLDPIVCEHTPEFAKGKQRCRVCGNHTPIYCPGCAKDDNSGPASGFYCMVKARNCMAVHHRKRAHTRAPDEAEQDS